MSRARRGFKARQRKRKIFKRAKGFHFDRRTKFRHTVQTVVRAMHYQYIGRRLLKRNMRRLWIIRIGAGAKQLGLSYSKLMGMLKKNEVQLNRKMLAELAARDFEAFKTLVKTVS